ncbi:MAG: hypothetical protein ACLRFM_03290 [Alphaproteobacteria bacterium]|nr:hypothetical protein [Alphaproteobacteria bacterium]MBQ9540438.1 hypothetical protein [Alphaproteobacteria bacterium]
MIYTGYWAKIKEYEQQNLTPVGISGWSPDGYAGKTYKKLAPKYAWWKEWHDNNLSEQWYINKYFETVLNKLNPRTVAQDLQQMGQNVVLLCFETPDKFCHRHLVATWLNASKFADVREYILKSNQMQMNL